ncbi:hypothetical protein [Kozakia baliensis]|uniref:hypothetical protein n=1 Tax=Kozakia baliensis TaxID=153496 RepID=UPI001247650F|nr:hypothetical protein [Kozakia baliensis]
MASPDFGLMVRSSYRVSPFGEKSAGSATLCACCGLPAPTGGAPWQGDAARRVCEICDLLQTPTRPTIDREAVLIWMPELSQPQVLALAGHAHSVLLEPMFTKPREALGAFWEHLVDALLSDRPLPILPESGLPAAQVLRVLHARAAEAFRRLQSTSPLQIVTAMMMADVSRGDVAKNLQDVLAGLRLLPVGRFYRGADDAYSDLLRARHALHARRS